ncbi:hypothetical protein TYRP_002662 [Tyrophagus putrescentiae]|nr:hypothetical protein TYRP_002662 [Tyrophagus putrescentiae]
MATPPAAYVPRAIQVIDSAELDAHFVDTIIGQLSRFSAELKALLQVYLWYRKQYLPPSDQQPASIGLDIFKLKFSSSSSSTDSTPERALSYLQKLSFLLPVTLLYLKERLSGHLPVKGAILVDKLTALLQVLNTVNCLLLIYGGRYRTLSERLFSVVVQPDASKRTQLQGPTSATSNNNNGSNSGNSNTSSPNTFFNREVMWRSLSETLTLLLPHLLASSRLKSAVHFLHRQLLTVTATIRSGGGGRGGSAVTSRRNSTAGQQQQQQQPAFPSYPISLNCPLCDRPANNATAFAGCQHVYCYYCLASRLKTAASGDTDNDSSGAGLFSCQICNAGVHSAEQLSFLSNSH